MNSERFKYLVVENAIDVCEGIERRMTNFERWVSLGYCSNVKEAISKIRNTRPHLIFLDWGLNGGSAYEVLRQIQNLQSYDPYIIFNTGFQSDFPDIPQEIINSYNVDKYLVKPFWENLRKNLPIYLKEAEIKSHLTTPQSHIFWAKAENKTMIPLPVTRIQCIVQNLMDARKRDIYISTQNTGVTVSLTWEDCYSLLDKHNIEYFITKTRYHLVVKKYIETFEKPYVRIKQLPFKIEVVKERIKTFLNWLEEKK